MRVRILASGETAQLPDSYAARLIEQGKAVLSPPVAEKDSAAFEPPIGLRPLPPEGEARESGPPRRQTQQAPSPAEKSGSQRKVKTKKG